MQPPPSAPAAHDRAIRTSLRAAEAQLPGRMEDAINRNLRGAKFGHYCIAASNVRLEVPLEVAEALLRDGRSVPTLLLALHPPVEAAGRRHHPAR